MIDLSNNTTPFGLLTPEEQEHMRNWPHGVELYGAYGWQDRATEVWFGMNTYRTKPAPVTKVEWANDYGDGLGDFGFWNITREGADLIADDDTPRIAVIRREWTEGHPPRYFTEDV